MRQSVRRPALLRGVITPPGDKSISHRSLILNAIAKGSAKVTGLGSGEDVVSTMRCLRSCGVEIEDGVEPNSVTVRGLEGNLREPDDVLDAGNSGTSMRLLAGVMAGMPHLSILTGDASLRSRPMGRVVKPLQLIGAHVQGRNGDTLAPLAIRGGDLRGIEYTLPVASAQLKSSIMLAALFASGETLIHQPDRSRDHTERMLRAMGARVEEEGLDLAIEPASLRAIDFQIPGDISGAAFWMVAAICHPDADLTIKGVGVNPTRSGILEALEGMGADLSVENPRLQGGEPVADLRVKSSRLKGLDVGGQLVPRIIDEIPVLAVAACFADGPTTIRDAQELRVKESDRVHTTVRELSRLGARIEERPDGMVIHGTGQLNGGATDSHGDHRLAMSLGVAGLVADGETHVEGADAASVSYPDFWGELHSLGSGHSS